MIDLAEPNRWCLQYYWTLEKKNFLNILKRKKEEKNILNISLEKMK